MSITQISYEEISEFFDLPNLLPHQQVLATTKARFPLAIGAQGSGKSLGGIVRSLIDPSPPYPFPKMKENKSPFPLQKSLPAYPNVGSIPTTKSSALKLDYLTPSILPTVFPSHFQI